MNEIASKGQLALSYMRWALVTVPTVVLLGMLSGYISNSGYQNRWFSALIKPDFMPEGWVFGAAWTVLYILLGLSVAVVIHARGARLRGPAIILFSIQFAANLAWSPLFFRAHQVTEAFYLIIVMIVLTLGMIIVFARIRTVAALLLLPYLGWLIFASVLTYSVDRLNPGESPLVGPTLQTQI